MTDFTTRSCDRPLSLAEAPLLIELLKRSKADAKLIAQVPTLRVRAEGSSSWPIVEFSDGGSSGGVIAESFWHAGLAVFGVHVLASSDLITCMECWSVNGHADPSRWPAISELRASTA